MPRYRVKEYHPHPGQLKLHKSTAKEVLVVSSIRAGKSFGVIHDAMRASWNNPTEFGTLICAPTYTQVTTIIEKPLVSRFKMMGLLKEYNGQRHEAVLKNGKVIYFRSLEDPDSATRGLNVWKCYIDEAAFCSKYAVDLVKSRLVTTGGQLTMITTPNGMGSWMYEDYIANKRDYVEYIKFSIQDNPLITNEAVEHLRRTLDPLLARQEIDGEWVNLFQNQVYYSFSDDVIGDFAYDPAQPVYIGLDFNIEKNAWCAFQRNPNNTFRMIYEGFGAKTTADVARQILDRYGSSPFIIPDATGGNKLQGTALTNFQLLRQAGVHNIYEKRSNPDRLKRYAIVNAALTNALGEHRIFIDRSCTETIRELRELSFKEGTDKINDKNGKAGHRTDAFGYALTYLTGDQVGKILTRSYDFVQDFKQRAALIN
jgi:hypothetical protein